jgi:hypothetical protein
MFIILSEGISFFLYNRQHEDGTNPIFCAVDGSPRTNSDVLDQIMLALWTCGRNFIFDRTLLQAISSPNDLMEIPVQDRVPAFNTRPMQIAANIIRSLILARHLYVTPCAPRAYRFVSVLPQDPVRSMMDLTCLNVSITSNADLVDLACFTLNFIYRQQQYGCICQPRHLIIRGAAEDCADLYAHYLDRRIRDIPTVIDEFSTHLKALWDILSSERPQTSESSLAICISYGRRACDIFPDVFRSDNILSELPAIIISMRNYLLDFSTPEAFQKYTLSQIYLFYAWRRQIYVLWRTVSSIKDSLHIGDQLLDIILSEALIILSANGTAGSSRR